MEEILQGLVAYFAGSPRIIAGQIIGFAPMILSFFVYIFNDRKKTIVLKTIMDVLWALHFFLIGAASGCVINMINSVRGVVFAQKGKKWASHIAIPIIFCAASAIGTFMSWEGIRSLLPLMGTTLAIMGFWCNEPYMMRRFTVPGVSLWLIYGCITGTVSGIICNAMSIVSMAIAEYNYRKQKKNGAQIKDTEAENKEAS